MAEEKNSKKVKITDRINLSVGLIVFLLALVGVFGIIRGSFLLIKESREEKKTAQYAAYNEFLIPAAAIDIQPFDDLSTAKMSELVEMCVWSVLNADADPARFEYSGGDLMIPEDMVEKEFARFFGDSVKIGHCTVEGYGYEFKYDETAGVYAIPLTTISPTYTPKVEKVEQKGGATVLTCGLVNASVRTLDPVTGELSAPAPDKYIKVTLRKSGSAEYISAIQLSGAPETASTKPAQEKTGETEETQTESPEETEETAVESVPAE